MKRSLIFTLTGWFCAAILASAAAAADPNEPNAAKPSDASGAKSPAKFTLRYKFQPGETVRWKVVHQAQVETTVSGTTQTAEADTVSVTAWRVKQVAPDGAATFEYVLESVDMRQKVSGRMETRYNSQTDKKAPLVFEGVAQTIGVPLTLVTLDAKGKVLKLQSLFGKQSADSEAQFAVRLPDKPVAIGESWSAPGEIEVSVQGGGATRIKILESCTLKEVQGDVATIHVATQILTPIHDPSIEAQVVQRESSGTIRFDLKAGRILARKIEVDKRVVGFAGNGASVLGYRTQFTSELLAGDSSPAGKTEPAPAEAQSAKRPVPPKAQ